MISFPNAKINIGLNVIRKRSDGFHELESIFYPVNICDALELIESDKLEFSSSGLTIEGDSENNLCLRAYRLLIKDYELPPLKIHLHKHIPMGAGIGGGSSDASFLIKMLDEKFSLNIGIKKMEDYAAQLGSDCAFFIQNKVAFSEGRGEILSQIALDLSSYFIVLVKPPLHVSTAIAFSDIRPKASGLNLRIAIKEPIQSWRGNIINDFEKGIITRFPAIGSIQDALYNSGAIYASMTGSGSSVYGIFERAVQLPELEQENRVFYNV